MGDLAVAEDREPLPVLGDGGSQAVDLVDQRREATHFQGGHSWGLAPQI